MSFSVVVRSTYRIHDVALGLSKDNLFLGGQGEGGILHGYEASLLLGSEGGEL